MMTKTNDKLSLYRISADLQELYEELENNGGELTPEIEDKLTIRQSELSTKLDNYVKMVKHCEMFIEACKAEKSRIDNIKKRYENMAKRFKESMATAVEKFGDTNKSGNKFIDLGMCRLTAMDSSAVDIDTEVPEKIVSYALSYLSEQYNESPANVSEKSETFMAGMLDYINACMEKDGRKKVEFGDVANLPVTVSISSTLGEVVFDQSIMEHLTSGNLSIKQNVTSSFVKTCASMGYPFSFAKKSDKKNLLIK